MANEVLKRDQNFVTVLGAVTDNVAQDIVMLRVDPTTKRLLISATGMVSGTVTNVATGTGLTGGPITTTGTISLDSKLAPLDTLGTAGQAIRVNAGATALEYFTLGGGSETLADVSALSTDATKSLYTMSSTIPIEFRSSDAHTLLYLDETNERIGVGNSSPSVKLQIGTSTYTGAGSGDTLRVSGATNPYLSVSANGKFMSVGYDTTNDYGRIKAHNYSGGDDLDILIGTSETHGLWIKATGDIIPTNLTASQIVATDGSKVLQSLTTATYPSLTELSYIKGVTSAIQTQINAKGAGTVTAVSVATANGVSGSSSGGATPALTITLGAITPSTVNGNTFTTGSSTYTGTAGQTYTFPSTTATVARTDAAQTFTGTQTFSQIVTTNNAITASGNAATVPITSRISTVTNNSAATLTITITTTSAVDGQMVMVRILDFSAAAHTITWVNTENSTVTAPTTSNGSTTLPLTVGFQYNNATSKWRCIASS